MLVKIHKIFLLVWIMSLASCIRLILPTSPDELKKNAKTTVTFTADRTYTEVYRDVLRGSKKCFDFSTPNGFVSTTGHLDRDKASGHIYVQSNFDTYIASAEMTAEDGHKTRIQIWSQHLGKDVAMKAMALGESPCTK